jgi:hypothetical protein
VHAEVNFHHDHHDHHHHHHHDHSEETGSSTVTVTDIRSMKMTIRPISDDINSLNIAPSPTPSSPSSSSSYLLEPEPGLHDGLSDDEKLQGLHDGLSDHDDEELLLVERMNSNNSNISLYANS